MRRHESDARCPNYPEPTYGWTLMEPIRVLFTASHLHHGGVTKHMTDLGTRLLERGHQVAIASNGPRLVAGGTGVDEVEALGIRHFVVPFLRPGDGRNPLNRRCPRSWAVAGSYPVSYRTSCTPAGGVRDQIIDGENGYVVPFNSPAELARVLLDYARDSTKRCEHGRKAASIALERFTLSAMTGAYLDAYRDAIRGGSAVQRARGAGRGSPTDDRGSGRPK